jgi:hypothetical protein
MMSPNARLPEITSLVLALSPQTPSSAVPAFIDLKGYEKVAILITAKNGTAPVGAAITLEQATAVGNTSGKALAYSSIWQATNTGPSGNTDTLTNTTVVSNTFTIDNTANTDVFAVIEIGQNDLDINNSFDCVRVNIGNTTNQTVSAVYVLWPAKFAGATPTSPIT